MDAKKNVTLEVRLPDVAKAAFMEHCRKQDRTASEAIRVFIDAQLDPRPATKRRSWWRVVLAWALGLAFGAGLAVPSLARSERSPAPSFAQLDTNHDGVLTPDEFDARQLKLVRTRIAERPDTFALDGRRAV